MLSLTRIFLYNWHRFHDHILDVQDSLYLAGHNGSGKSSVLDAIQVILIADQTRVRFNSSAQDRSQRNLDSYVRGKIGEQRYLRPGNTVGYIALEMKDTVSQQRTVLGVCIEAGEGQEPKRTYFILPDALDRALFIPAGRPLSRQQLKQALRQQRGRGRAYDQVGEYQSDMLNALGGLNPRFFDLFLRALTFQPIRNIQEFVEQWLLKEEPLDVEPLQRVVENLESLRLNAREVEARQLLLQEIVTQQQEVQRLHTWSVQYQLLARLLRFRQAGQQVAHLEGQVARCQQALRVGEEESARTEAVIRAMQEEVVEARTRLNQFDGIRRQRELTDLIAQLTHRADAMRRRWQALLQEIEQERIFLRFLLEHAPLEEPERAGFQRLLDSLHPLSPTQPPGMEVAEQLDATLSLLKGLHHQAQQAQFRLEEELRGLKAAQATVQEKLRALQVSRKPTYPAEVERFRTLLMPVVGDRPYLLCELLRIDDERWQDAVEAMLGWRRFTIIVAPDHFDVALKRLDQARAQDRLYDVSLLDLGRVQAEGRPARPGSLAEQVRAEAPLLQSYINSVLGDIITCPSVATLRQHHRAVTPEVVVFSEWTARALPEHRYRPWFIGEQARRSQMETLERERSGLAQQVADLAPKVEEATQWVRFVDRQVMFARLSQQLRDDLDEHSMREQIALHEAERDALDLSPAEALQRHAERVQQQLEAERERERGLLKQLADRRAERTQLEEATRRARFQLAEAEQEAAAAQAQHPEAMPWAESRLAELPTRESIESDITNADNQARKFETQARNERDRLRETTTVYNTRHSFSALAGDPNEGRYAAELERLEATELPQFQERIEKAQREAEEELREHVLHRLREQILRAKDELNRLNDALARLHFHGDRYRFRYDPNEALREFYTLLTRSEELGDGALYASPLYHQNQDTFQRFYESLTQSPRSAAEREEQVRLTDYRRYLTYDIEVTQPDGQQSRWSRIMGQTSGGETQTPFYLAIAASFVQLYRIHERSSRPTIRLVAFDEAFSKMDQDRIGSTLELFQSFELQVITATPLERCEYLVPKMCTNLVLTGVADTVLVEPYHNYQARLERFHAPSD